MGIMILIFAMPVMTYDVIHNHPKLYNFLLTLDYTGL